MEEFIQRKRVEYWDNMYKNKIAKWDRDYVSPILEKVFNDNLIKPCKVISLGCGSGTNEIYLAEK